MIGISENRMDGEPGSIVGWAKIIPDSFRMVRFISPRTNNYLNGVCVLLEGEAEEVWILSSGNHIWKRAEGWQRTEYLKRIRKELESGTVEEIPLDVDDIGQL